jgi:hypothetical protein
MLAALLALLALTPIIGATHGPLSFTLEVTVESARNLPAGDFFSNSADPFVRV